LKSRFQQRLIGALKPGTCDVSAYIRTYSHIMNHKTLIFTPPYIQGIAVEDHCLSSVALACSRDVITRSIHTRSAFPLEIDMYLRQMQDHCAIRSFI
jgi:hypothetical protein